MNSWNNAVSYACNLKIHSLGLCDEVYEKLKDILDNIKEYKSIGMSGKDYVDRFIKKDVARKIL